ncbi:hypothetical protein CC80DRAFT_200630 [Byssothecium circinans]|uniref:Cytochrome P450 n=1 Tax=Byssothecium circinans TaxID=147558 RepID=A0A6A5UDC3_9PLEO|nr:hypothetical protein CC80DRAFT_200630 [Byssothecium circinans]
MLPVYHIFEDTNLLNRVRENIEENISHATPADANLSERVKDPLLSSIQAEVLRLYVNVCIMVNSPHSDVPLGRWWMPKGSTALVHFGITHMDDSFWNTKDELHPVKSFWADRFVTYPHDRPKSRNNNLPNPQRNDGKPWCSLQGLEASWMPYGGKS